MYMHIHVVYECSPFGESVNIDKTRLANKQKKDRLTTSKANRQVRK